MKVSRNITNFILILGIMFYVLSLLGIINVSLSLITAWLFMVYGLTAVLVTIGTQRKAYLFIGTVLFMIGIVLYISSQYLFSNPKALLFPSSLFIIGSGFLILFIDDTANRVFLYSAAILMMFSLISIWLTRSFGIMQFINTLSSIVIDYSPIFIILIGISILVNRKKNKL